MTEYHSIGQQMEHDMPRVVGIDHLVLSVGDLARSKEYYNTVLGFLGFKLKHDLSDFAGWSNGKTLFWIAQADGADSAGRQRRHRKDSSNTPAPIGS